MSWRPHLFGLFCPTGCGRPPEFAAYQACLSSCAASLPNAYAVAAPARAAYSHSASVGSRYSWPVFSDSQRANSIAPWCCTFSAGWRPLPKPNDSSPYGGVGRVTASALPGVGGPPGCDGLAIDIANANASYSSHVVSFFAIQNGAIRTSCAGPSSALRPGSDEGLPIVKVPPGMATMSMLILVPGTAST